MPASRRHRYRRAGQIPDQPPVAEWLVSAPRVAQRSLEEFEVAACSLG